MAAITDLSDYINIQTGGNNGNPLATYFFKYGRTSGTLVNTTEFLTYTCWNWDGMPGIGANPGATCTQCTNSTEGAIPLSAPGGSREKFLTSLFGMPTSGGTVLLVDRLIHIRNLVGNSTGTQNVQTSTPSPILPRNESTGAGNMIVVEIFTALGSTASTITATYKNQANSTATTVGVTIGGSGNSEVSRAIILPLAAGDTGVRSVTSVSLTPSTGTAGNFGVAVVRPLAAINVTARGAGQYRDYVTGLPTMPALLGTECLSLIHIPAVTITSGVGIAIHGMMGTVEN